MIFGYEFMVCDMKLEETFFRHPSLFVFVVVVVVGVGTLAGETKPILN